MGRLCVFGRWEPVPGPAGGLFGPSGREQERAERGGNRPRGGASEGKLAAGWSGVAVGSGTMRGGDGAAAVWGGSRWRDGAWVKLGCGAGGTAVGRGEKVCRGVERRVVEGGGTMRGRGGAAAERGRKLAEGWCVGEIRLRSGRNSSWPWGESLQRCGARGGRG